ncbi:MAG TPA: gamma-glutamyltransferase [Stenomitos sp.]
MFRKSVVVSLALSALFLVSAVATAAPVPAQWAFPAEGPPVKAKHGMVSCVSPIASRVGVDILKRGGNAIDAAVAVAFTMAVTWPEAGNVGGGGFMVMRDQEGKTYALDYRETAPARATRDMFLAPNGEVTDKSLVTRLGAGTPGTVWGMYEVHRKFGRLAWPELLAPAIKLANEGFVVDKGLAASLEKYQADLRRNDEAARIFLKDGQPLKVGDRLYQPDLARTLRLVASRGPEGFYQGPVAEAFEEDMQDNGGLMTAADLAAYRPKWREPISFGYKGLKVVSMPPPSSGGFLLASILKMVEQDDVQKLGWHSPAHIHLIAEAERRAFADRNAYMGDPDFIAVPLKRMLDSTYLKERRATVDPAKATPEYSTKPGLQEHEETTHFLVVDSKGNVVSNTYTLNGAYGSCIVVPGTGVLLNNEMDDFTSKPGAPNLFGLVQGEKNAIAPKKRMLSSMSPTLVLDARGNFRMAVGSPGGSTIPTTTLQVLMNYFDFGMNVRQAVVAPRFHHQGLPQSIDVEPAGFDAATLKALEGMGHPLHERYLGDAQAIVRKPDGSFEGWADPRKGGLAVGY